MDISRLFLTFLKYNIVSRILFYQWLPYAEHKYQQGLETCVVKLLGQIRQVSDPHSRVW